MFTISKNKVITVAKGDSFIYKYKINYGTDLDFIGYELKENDFLYFAVIEPNQPFENALILKRLDINNLNDKGELEIKFSSEETSQLDLETYFYTIKLHKIDLDKNTEDVDTLVQRKKFIVL